MLSSRIMLKGSTPNSTPAQVLERPGELE